jgi:hypothetical protein
MCTSILSVYHLKKPITLQDLKEEYGIGAAPREVVYMPSLLAENVKSQEGKKIR